MKPSEMKPGCWYIVTKDSKSGEFQTGDHVKKEDDGSISSREAAGWMEPEDLPEATEGMEVEIDAARLERQKQQLLDKLSALEKA